MVRTIYLYLFSLLGLVLLIIGGVRFLEMGLKAFVFTKAEDEQRFFYQEVPIPYHFLQLRSLGKKSKKKKRSVFLRQKKPRLRTGWLITRIGKKKGQNLIMSLLGGIAMLPLI